MDAKTTAAVLAAALAAVLGLGAAAGARASTQPDKAAAREGAEPEVVRFMRSLGGVRPAVFANRPQNGAMRPLGPAPVTRADKPVAAVTAAGPGQAGYVHFFIVRLPHESLEIQVGIELSDQRIAWSFPGLGAAVSPFMENGTVEAGGAGYKLWHLYGLRPFPDEPAMAALRRELPGRVDAIVGAGTPYCLDDGPRSGCMSCLGFVLRVLFPGEQSEGFPRLPRDFLRSGSVPRYSTTDLVLYLAGMLELPTRQARLKRLSQLSLPPDLRSDLDRFIREMAPVAADAETPRRAPKGAAAKAKKL